MAGRSANRPARFSQPRIFLRPVLIRTFIAVTLAVSTVEEIAKVQALLREAKADIRWVRAENMHLTLKFLGDIDHTQVAPILDRLHSTLQAQSVFPVLAQGLGGFPNLTRPRVVWAGLIGDTLTTVSQAVETALVPLNFPLSKRPFRPHITLGRVRSQRGWSDVLARVQQYQQTYFGESIIDQVTLYQSSLQSDLQPSRTVYTPLGSISLQAL